MGMEQSTGAIMMRYDWKLNELENRISMLEQRIKIMENANRNIHRDPADH